MSWLRTDDGYPQHPKFEGWTKADKWDFLELMHYCAKYRTGGRVPADLALLPRGVTTRLLKLAESSGWLDRDENGSLWVHDWDYYNPKDPTAAERMKRHRDRNANRNGNGTTDRNDDRNETVTRAQAGADSRPVPSVSTSLSQDLERPERERETFDDQEQARRAAWTERSTKPDIHSPGAFVTAGMRGGGWPDPYDGRTDRPTENGSGSGPAYIAGLIRNGVLTDRADLETELDLAGVEDADRSSLVAQLQLAQRLEGRE